MKLTTARQYAAKNQGISYQFILKLCKENKIPALNMGNRFVFEADRADEVIRHLMENSTNTIDVSTNEPRKIHNKNFMAALEAALD